MRRMSESAVPFPICRVTFASASTVGAYKLSSSALPAEFHVCSETNDLNSSGANRKFINPDSFIPKQELVHVHALLAFENYKCLKIHYLLAADHLSVSSHRAVVLCCIHPQPSSLLMPRNRVFRVSSILRKVYDTGQNKTMLFAETFELW